MIPRPLVIYGMSHATTLIELLTGTPCHVYYSLDYSDLRLLHDHGPINLGEKCVHLYSAILHPKLLNLFGGYWAYIDSKDQLVVNTRFMQQMRDSLERIPNHVSFGFLNGNEHHVNTLTKNRFLRDFLLPANPEFPFILDRPLISLASFDSHMRRWSSGTYATYQMMADLLGPDRYYCDPPPPIADTTRVVEFNEGYRADAIEYGVNELSIRQKIYLRYCELLHENNAALAFTRVRSPIVSENSISLPNELARDVTHGNTKYAELVINQIKQRC